jgi:hypothetical protein
MFTEIQDAIPRRKVNEKLDDEKLEDDDEKI